MKIGIYPGSFNPWHEGHTDILGKALQVFDKVIVARGVNPEKSGSTSVEDLQHLNKNGTNHTGRVEIASFEGLLVDFVKDQDYIAGVIRGLRNGHDLQYEMNQQYWNEDLGLEVPTVYFICDRKLSHISSSAIRALNKIKDKK